jgi:hypothetical protein
MGALEPGVVVAGYRIGSLLGRGGMGVVYRARDHDLERDVALKVIAPELVEDAHVRTRFLREARAAAAIEHPHVIPVHAAGEQDGVAFLAMRLVNGDDLRTLVRREGAVSPARACELIEQAAAALDAIHEAGFVHRDVKPGNLLVDRSGHLYLTDFGLVKHVLTSDGASRTGGWVGTVDFMAPEQIRGGRVDARADVYSLGGVLHYLLTARVPFEREGEEAKLWAQLAAEPPRPSTANPGLPRTFDAVIARALAKDPDERYPSAGDLARAARAAESGTAPTLPERTVARGAAAPGASPSEPGLVEEVRTVTSGRRSRRPRRRLWGALAGVLLIGAGAGAAALAWPEREAPRKPSTSGAPAAAQPAVAETVEGVVPRPTGLAYASGVVWVSGIRNSRLTRIDAASGRKLASTRPVGQGPSSLVGYRNSVWVAARRSREVVRVNALTGRVDRRIRLASIPQKLAVGRLGVWIAVHRAGGSDLLRYDHRGDLQYTIWFQRRISAMAVTDKAVYIDEDSTSRLLRLDPKTREVYLETTIPGTTFGLYAGGGYLWAVLRSDDSIARVDTEDGSVVPTAAGRSPTQVVVADERVFVASRNDHTVQVLDLEGRPAQDPLAVDFNPYALATDGRSVWVTGLANDTVTRIALP